MYTICVYVHVHMHVAWWQLRRFSCASLRVLVYSRMSAIAMVLILLLILNKKTHAQCKYALFCFIDNIIIQKLVVLVLILLRDISDVFRSRISRFKQYVHKNINKINKLELESHVYVNTGSTQAAT
jgi:hypothetical protein